MGKLSRTKGHSFEREIARQFQRELGFEDVRRHLEYQDGEANGVDLVNTWPFLIQCKKRAGYSPVSTLGEILRTDNNSDCVPMVITQADRKPACVILYWDDMKRIIKFANPFHDFE